MAIMNCIVRRSFLIVSLGLLLAQSTAQKTPELRMNTGVPPGTVTAQGLSVCADGDTVYVTWSDDRGGFGVKGVFLNRSLDAGSTWLPGDVQVNRSGATTWAEKPALAAEGSTVYVAWVDARNGLGRPSIYFNRSLDKGVTWLFNDVRLDTERQFGTAFTPAIACHGDAVYVTWSDRRQGLVYDDIYFNRSLDRGSTWLPVAVRINTGNSFSQSEQLEPSIAATEQTVCVIWQDYRNHDPEIYANRSLDRGTSWLSNDVQLDLPNSTSSNARIAASSLSVYVAWQAGVNLNDIYCNRSLDGGTSWLNTPRRLDLGSAPGAASSATPDIAADGLLVYATWVDKRNGAPGDVYLNRSFDGGMTWLAEEEETEHRRCPGLRPRDSPADGCVRLQRFRDLGRRPQR